MKKDYTVLKWICSTIMICCALIMYFSIFPHNLDITFDTSDGIDRMVNLSERIAGLQYENQCDPRDCLNLTNIQPLYEVEYATSTFEWCYDENRDYNDSSCRNITLS